MLAAVWLLGLVGSLWAAPIDDYNVAVELFRKSRWEFANESFRKFLADHPAHEKAPLARLYLGLTLVNQSDFDAARTELRKFLELAPQNANAPQARYRVAECSYLLSDWRTAKTELQAYLKDHPQEPLSERAWAYLGDVELQLDDPAAAVTAFSEGVTRFPQGTMLDDARLGWAKALEAQNKLPEAIAKYRELATGTTPRAAEALFRVGTHEFDTGEFAAAAKTYQSLIERFPGDVLVSDAHLNAGFALYRQADYDGATAAFTAAASDPARQLTAGYWKALCLKSQAKYDAALAALVALEPVAANEPLAEAIVFQRGMCERLSGKTTEAQQTLLAVVTQYPQGEYADDALHFATELAIEADDLAAAEERLKRFTAEYPRSGLRMYQELLAGRYELARASALVAEPASVEALAARYAAAAKHFEGVLKESTLPRTRSQARYFLGLTRQLQGDHAAALEALKPLVDEVLAGENAAEFADALILQADSLIQTTQPAAAITAAKAYLERFPKGRQRQRCYGLLATAQQRFELPADALQTLAVLLREFPDSAVTDTLILQAGEAAEERSDWPAAIKNYQLLAESGTPRDAQAYALRGLGWAQLQSPDHPAAATTFAKLIAAYPGHSLLTEARYYRAEALKGQGDHGAAGMAFAELFTALAPNDPAPEGAETSGPLLFAYRAGLNAARSYREANQIDQADASFAAFFTKFPQAPKRDQLLDEWAILNYNAERYDRADTIFRRLIEESPDSDLADNARLSLAESELIADRREAARAAFESLRADPKSDAGVRERAHYQLLVIALEEARWADVLTLGAEFRQSYPASPTLAYVDYAAAESVLADPKASNERLEQLIPRLQGMMAKLPVDSEGWAPRLWVLSAETLFRLKRYDEVAPLLEDLRTKLPTSTLMYQVEEVLGRCYKQQAKFPEARTALERVLADPAAFGTETAAKSQYLIAETWFLQEKWKEAFLAYQKVYASYKFPEWQAAALLQSGLCDENLKQPADAIQSYDQLITEFPASTHVAEATRRKAMLQSRTGTGS
jgi:TolA-binding protein